MPTYNGTPGDDVYTGTSANDTIYGGDGNDTLNGAGGDDRIEGGIGNDTIDGGAGDDFIYIDRGADTVTGGADTDTIQINYYNGAGPVTVDLRNLWTGGVGLVAGGTVVSVEAVARIETSGFNDTVYLGRYLGDSFDTALGGGDDTATGGERTDRLFGGDGNDSLNGAGGDDYVEGGIGNDTIDGGAGDDFILIDRGADTVTGGADTDRIYINYYYGAGPITVDLRNLWAGGIGLVAGGTVVSVEAVARIETSAFDDTVYLGSYLGGSFDTVLGGGDDTATGGERTDRLSGGDGNDTLNGAGGDDYIVGGIGNDTIDGGAGDDFIYIDRGADTVTGGVDTDTIQINYYYGAGPVTVDLRNLWTGGVGLIAGGTVVSVEAVEGIRTSEFNDTVYLGTYLGGSFDTVLGGGDDTAAGGARADQLFGNDGNDILNGAGGDNYLDGGIGNDALTTGDGEDELYGGDGVDTLNAGAGADYLDGGTGADVAVFSGLRDAYLVYANAAGRIFVRERAPGGAVDELYRVETLRFDNGDFDPVATAGYLGALIHVAGDGRESAYPAPIYQNLATATNGDDTLTGTSGNDVVFTGNGGDTVSTGVGDDRIEAQGAAVVDTDGNAGDGYAVVGGDAIFAGAGNDTIVLGYESSVDGGADLDQVFLDLRFAAEHWVAHTILGTFNYLGVDVDLGAADAGTVVIEIGGIGDLDITLTDIEQFDITFGSGNDRVFGGAQADRFDGDSYNFPGGNDELHGRGGNDRLYGGNEADVLFGDEGNDQLNGGQQSPGFDDYDRDELHGGADDDLLIGGNRDFFDGGAGFDRAEIRLYGSTHDFVLDLDVLTSPATFDFGDGGLEPGTQTAGIEDLAVLLLGSGNDIVTGHVDSFAGAGTPFAGMTHELDGGDGDDSFHLIGTLQGNYRDFLSGGDGNDTLLLDGDYAKRLELGYSGVRGFETIALAPGHDYALGVAIAFDAVLVDGSALGAGDQLDFEILDVVPAGLRILGGAGNDHVFGGAYFNPEVRVDLGGGSDTLTIDVDFANGLFFLADTMANVETLRFAHDVFGLRTYDLTLHASNVAAGALLTVDGSLLGAGFLGLETLRFDGSAVVAGRFAATGGDGADTLIGGGLADLLSGGEGDDQLDGRAGRDTMQGGIGSDTFTVDDAHDTVIELVGEGTDLVKASISFELGANVENLTLTGSGNLNGGGNTLANVLTGNTGANWLVGLTGADVLDGGLGADRMEGGADNDSYYVDNTGDRVTEAANAGTDQVFASISLELAANVENLTLTGSGNLSGGGNALANVLTGNAGANWLVGLAGNDTLDGGLGTDRMEGGTGNDTYTVDNAGDRANEKANEGIDQVMASITFELGANVENLALTGSGNAAGAGNALANVLTGNAGNNWLVGLAGADLLDGGAGADKMDGGADNDTYVVDNAGDRANEKVNEGTDLVQASISFELGANVENLTLTGSGNINGGGNALNNLLTGNAGNNWLVGLAGNDTLNGGLGADRMQGGDGNDTYYVDNAGDRTIETATGGADHVVASISFELAVNLENLTLTGSGAIAGAGNTQANLLTGNAGANWLVGLAGNDTLDGGIGADRMDGGTGNDTYRVDNAGDRATENAGEGTDLVQASVSFELGAEVENLTLTGSGNINGGGNALNNVLTGNAGNNWLASLAGNDVLDGGLGTDQLDGGAGLDTFAFTTALGGGNIDTITAFVAADDTIQIENAVFTGLAAGALAAGAYNTGAAASQADDRIIYDANTGALLFDVDGLGGAAGVQFATLTPGLTLTSADFLVI